jgi:hypothetical protein
MSRPFMLLVLCICQTGCHTIWDNIHAATKPSKPFNAPKHNQVLNLCNKTPQQNTYRHEKQRMHIFQLYFLLTPGP